MTTTLEPPRRGARIRGWLALAAAVILVALVGALLASSTAWNERERLDPESAGPDGARAIARVLAAQGIDVRVARDRAAASAALAGGRATLALPDVPGLTDTAVRELVDAAREVVLLEPQTRTLRLLMPGSALAGAYADGNVAPRCEEPVARRAGDIRPGELFTPGPGARACYPSGAGFALLRATDGERTMTALDARALLANDSIDRAGNAALALSVLGAQPTLVWYMPSPGDADAAPPTLGELTPGWVTPAIVLLLTAGILAAVWRGRRFGPLVSETLPVTVRAVETTVGRGRLYARSHDAAHAAAQLRNAAVERLSRTLGLGPAATPAAVADAAARRLGSDAGPVRTLLVAPAPRTDRELVDFSDRLQELEAAVRAAVRPEGTPT